MDDGLTVDKVIGDRLAGSIAVMRLSVRINLPTRVSS
jgi:hypothetical protein